MKITAAFAVLGDGPALERGEREDREESRGYVQLDEVVHSTRAGRPPVVSHFRRGLGPGVLDVAFASCIDASTVAAARGVRPDSLGHRSILRLGRVPYRYCCSLSSSIFATGAGTLVQAGSSTC